MQFCGGSRGHSSPADGIKSTCPETGVTIATVSATPRCARLRTRPAGTLPARQVRPFAVGGEPEPRAGMLYRRTLAASSSKECKPTHGRTPDAGAPVKSECKPNLKQPEANMKPTSEQTWKYRIRGKLQLEQNLLHEQAEVVGRGSWSTSSWRGSTMATRKAKALRRPRQV